MTRANASASESLGLEVLRPEVSVVVIFLNAAPFLEEALESVAGQTFADWEVVMVDDGSADGSSELALAWAARHRGKARYLEHPGHANRGKSVSRNLGVREARGEWIAFLDADDCFLPNKLERQMEWLRRQPEAVMIYGATRYWFGWTGDEADERKDYVGKLGVSAEVLYRPPELMRRYLEDSGIVPCICGLLARKRVIEEVGGFEAAIADLYEDQVFLAKLILHGPVFVEGGCGELYRQHAGSTSALAIRDGRYHPSRPNAARRDYLQWLEGYLRERRVVDPGVWRALRRELRPYRHPALARGLCWVEKFKAGVGLVRGWKEGGK